MLANSSAQIFPESGTSVLADSFGTVTGPEALTVSWSVVENASDIYTYTYTVNNPVGDVALNNDGTPTIRPEIVDAFSVAFDTTVSGAYLTGSQTGGQFGANNGTAGLFWYFTAVNPGNSSGPLSFESDLPPTLGNANALNQNPPSPWSSSPDGQQVPVPGNVTVPAPEPTTTTLLALTALLLLPFRSNIFRFMRGGEKAGLSR